MTATERIRAMLVELGVEWEACRVPTLRSELAATFWYDRDGNSCSAVEGADDVPDGKLSVNANLTPEQAIEATLGGDLKAENDRLRELVRDLYMALWTCNQYTCKHGNDGCYTEDGNSGGRCTLHDRMYELGVGL